MNTTVDLGIVHVERLFSRLCDQNRSSPNQSRRSIVQQSKQRMSGNKFDQAATNLVAANDLLRNRPEKSLRLLSQVSSNCELDSDSCQIAGFACVLIRQFQHAHEHLTQSVNLDPHRPDCWTLLGKLSESQGQEGRAVEYYKRAMVLDERSSDSAIALSHIQMRKHDLRDAIHTLRVCLLRDQRSPKLNIALAKLLRRRATVLRGKRKNIQSVRLLKESLDCYLTANASNPGAQSLIAQGRLQQKLNQFHAARESFSQAVVREPQSAAALTMLAVSNVDCGDLEAAISHFQSALQIEPHRAFTHFRYSRAQKFIAGPETQSYIASLRSMLSGPSHERSGRVLLHFALAKVLEDTGDYDGAWQNYDQANRLKSQHTAVTNQTSSRQRRSSKTTFARRVSDTAATFSQGFFRDLASVGSDSDTPIFIVGMPRSGTTLTEQILSSHPSVAGAGELHFLDHIHHDLKRSEAGVTTRQLSAEWFRKSADFYLAQLEQYRDGPQHVTDKMPTNFMHLGLIATLFPNAKIVQCRRNPMDVFVSSYCQNLRAPFCDLEQLVDYYYNYRRLMKHWEETLPIKIHAVQYEALTIDPLKHSRELVEHCGLKWNQQCLEFHKNDRAVHTPSKWQVRQPMYQSSVEKWRRYEKHLQPIAEKVKAICDEFDS